MGKKSRALAVSKAFKFNRLWPERKANFLASGIAPLLLIANRKHLYFGYVVAGKTARDSWRTLRRWFPMGNKWYWPDVSDLDGAKLAVRNGMWYAVFVAGVTALFAFLALAGVKFMGIKADALLDAALFAGIAYGLSRYSRIAAVAGFALFVLEKIYMLVTTGKVMSVGILGVIIALGFLNAVRGAFAYAKLGGAPEAGGFGGVFSGKSAPSPGARPLQM